MTDDGVILSTERLSLRRCIPEDVPRLHDEVFSDPAVMRFVFSGATFSVDETATFVRANFEVDDDGVGFAALVERMTNKVIGFSGLARTKALGQDDLELGFVIGRSYWGQGYATEIGHGQIVFGFTRLRRRRLIALVDPDNARSIHVLEKLGMRRECDLPVEGRGVRRVYRIDVTT